MYLPKDYWSSLAETYGKVDSAGFAPILHPGAPLWFNQLIDKLQFAALRRALAVAELPVGAKILDVGCGTGRWLRRYNERGLLPIGMDATLGMLPIARACQTNAPLAVGLASELPFADGSFDCVSDVTVVQHIPYTLQSRALAEMVRVLKPGGRLILLELVSGRAPHIFPRHPDEWIREGQLCGTTLVACFGQEYLIPDRVFVKLARAVFGRRQDTSHDGPLNLSNPGMAQRSAAQILYWHLRRVTVYGSVCIEPAIQRVCPAPMASHATFVFRKL